MEATTEKAIKMTTTDLYEMFEASGMNMSRLKVIMYVISNTNPYTSEFLGSYDTIARETGVSKDIVAMIMQFMQDEGLIKKVGRGAWRFAERFIFGMDEKAPGHEKETPLFMPMYV